ncbi:DUF397 domain-containing protein [Saccharopolyspora flava]|uniref:DUF397 domain-containing protein n=1 Tax=Saccharopolyspora flava TaxID=95161 RepID=A0A1I6SEL2_9PSEU|nr:DUF397 domain-containing protein [Saccharopolyspora flava]SFS75387.1 protein of unknown function [Saccharopolyspora flava]
MSNPTNSPAWRKSSRSGGAQQCVEVATNVPGSAFIRDSKLGEDSPVLRTSPKSFAAFLDAIKDDRLS